MNRGGLLSAGLAGALTLLGHAGQAGAQVCGMPESARVDTPAAPPPMVGEMAGGTSAQFSLGVGHVHYSSSNPVVDLPPGADFWPARAELPLSEAPDAAPFAWIAGGWIVAAGMAPQPLALSALVETGYEEPSFVVTERRPDGWLRLRYAEGEGEEGLAWTPACALQASPARLEATLWSDWFMGNDTSPLYFRSSGPHGLRSEPSGDAANLTEISGEHILEPLEVRGEWMRVVLKQPSDYCSPDAVPVRTEGWVRWISSDAGPELWYYTRGC